MYGNVWNLKGFGGFLRNQERITLKDIYRLFLAHFKIKRQYARFKIGVCLPISFGLSFITQLCFTEYLFIGSWKSIDNSTEMTCIKPGIDRDVLFTCQQTGIVEC